jgi:uncharacterized protein YigA (DUF484 family)
LPIFCIITNPFRDGFRPNVSYRLFGQHAPETRSVAVMRWANAGMLAIGSNDADHFQPGMGTMFLKMISATITASLARMQDGA